MRSGGLQSTMADGKLQFASILERVQTLYMRLPVRI